MTTQLMDKEPEQSPKSPHKATTSPSGSFHMEDVNFYGSPLMEFEAFSSVLSPTPVFEFKADPAPSGGGDAGDEVEENNGVGVPLPLPLPQPLSSLYEIPVPPFLSKTYDLVNDRTLDPIISWGAAGESFVVWDPVEFARIVLPRNFKHNNFSSFVRQLNTYGFRKIDSDKWEFANEAFQRGEKHLLKNIQRRRTLQSQQTVSCTGPSTKAGKLELESEIETLRKERGEIMQEVVQLQHQQRGSVHHMEAVNQRLQAAEQRQKQMVSCLAKLFQNPAFIARLKQTKEQRDNISSPRMKRKFVKHQAQELTESPMEGQVVKYVPESKSHLFSPVYEEAAALEFQIENLQSNELEAAQGLMNTPAPFGEGTSDEPQFKGKSVMSSPLQEFSPEYFVSSPKNKDFPEFSSIVKEEDIWSMGFESETGMLNSSQEMWGNIGIYDVPEIVSSSGGFSDIWDLGPLQVAGSSGTKWPSDESPVNEPESHTDQTNSEK